MQMQCHLFQQYFLFAPCCSVDPRRWLPWRHVVGVASRRLSLAAEKGSFIVPRRTGFRLQGKMFRNSYSFPENIGDWISQDPFLFCIGILLLLNYQVLLRCMRSVYSVIYDLHGFFPLFLFVQIFFSMPWKFMAYFQYGIKQKYSII